MPDLGSSLRPRRERYLVGLIGEGITASLTPAMHEAEARAMGLDYEYRIAGSPAYFRKSASWPT